jgi:3-hydroxyisobutyrate dehydrogenase-like beta-hydroxyacid dehydrogenase
VASCLVRAGFTVHVNDARREIANNIVQQSGGDASDTLRQLTAASDVVITKSSSTGWRAAKTP